MSSTVDSFFHRLLLEVLRKGDDETVSEGFIEEERVESVYLRVSGRVRLQGIDDVFPRGKEKS